jgi:membrane-associated phospholipid phosphatase
MISVVMNYYLKLAIAIERPPESYWYEGIEASNYSTPSGHSQNSATLFGWFITKIKTWWIFVISATLIVLIGLSRVYLGVHYLEDVLLGWGIGLLSVVLLVILEKPLTEFFSHYKEDYLYAMLFFFGFGATLVSTYLLPLPPNDNFGSLGGLIMGLAIALPLEKRYVGFSVEAPGGQKWRLILRVAFGILFVLGIMLGLSSILPTTEVWLRTIRYMLVTLVGAFVWPLMFSKLRL